MIEGLTRTQERELDELREYRGSGYDHALRAGDNMRRYAARA